MIERAKFLWMGTHQLTALIKGNASPIGIGKGGIVLFLLCLQICLAQPLDSLDSVGKRWFDTKYDSFREAPDYFLAEGLGLLSTYEAAEQFVDYAWVAYGLGRLHRKVIYDYAAAATYFDQSATAFLQTYDSIGLALALNNLGYCQMRLGEWEVGRKQLHAAIGILDRNEHGINWGYALNSLGNLEKASGDFQRALGYLHQAKRVGEFMQDPVLQGYAWNNIGTCYDESKQLDSAYFAYQESYRLLTGRTRETDLATILLNLGRIAGARNEGVSELAHYQEGLRIYESHGDLKGLSIVHVNLMNYWQARRQWDQAETHGRLVIELARRMSNRRDEMVAWKNLGWMAHVKGDDQGCKAHFDQALAIAAPRFLVSPQQVGPEVGQIRMPFESIHLLHHYGIHYAHMSQKQGWDRAYLDTSAAYYRAAIDLLDTLRLQSFAKNSQAHVAGINYGVFPQAITVNFERFRKTGNLRFVEEMWQIGERSRNFLLYQAYKQPNPLQDNHWFDNHRSLASHQATLMAHQATIIYLPGDPLWYGLRITRDSIVVAELGDYSVIGRQVDSLRQRLTESWTLQISCQAGTHAGCDKVAEMARASSAQYSRLAHELYQQLWEPLVKGKESFSDIQVIADGKLQLLPFDALLSHPPAKLGEFRTYPYLLRKHTIRYAYGLTEPPATVQVPGKVIGLAPFLNRGSDVGGLSNDVSVKASINPNWHPLVHSAAEMEALRNTYRATTLEGTHATKAWLVEKASSFSILHFSSHAVAHLHQPEASFLVLADTLLSFRDIQQQIWPSELVVLSACQTGIGEFQVGEGILSLGRAFHESGARSTLTTLWRVEDRATSELMTAFYKELAARKNKAVAMRKAKLAYISAHDHRLSHPFFWSGWMLMGNDDPIYIPNPFPWWALGGFCLGLGFIGLLIRWN